MLDQHVKRPVLVYERIITAQHLRIFKRYLFKSYRNKLRFLGEVSFSQSTCNLLSLGARYQHLPTGIAPVYISLDSRRRFHAAINDGLATIMAAAKLDDGRYVVTDWFQKKGRLMVYVTKKVDHDLPSAASDEDTENRQVA